MGYIKSGLFISLDGVIADPETWHFPYFDDQMGAAVESMMANDATLLGRKTYDDFAGVLAQGRPRRPDDRGHERRSQVRRLDHRHRSRVGEHHGHQPARGDDVAAADRRLKEDTGLGTTGSATLVQWLLEQGLVDELHLLVHPIVVGHGKKLFADGTTVPLKLLVLDYVRQRRPAPGVRRLAGLTPRSTVGPT